MSVEPIRDQGQTLSYPRGKVLGIVDTQAQLDDVVAALKSTGFGGIRALHGEDGVGLLERVNNFFFSDLEDRVLEPRCDQRLTNRRNAMPGRNTTVYELPPLPACERRTCLTDERACWTAYSTFPKGQ
jgi:hypothetical protein